MKIFKPTTTFPKEEKYGLTSQIRRSVISIPPNIADGYGHKTALDYIRMLYRSYGSVCRLATQILLAKDSELIQKGALDKCKQDIAEIESMLKAMITYLDSNPLTLWILGPFSPTKLGKSIFQKLKQQLK